MKLNINNETIELKKIGKGTFSYAYADNFGNVYVMTKTSDKKEVDYSKEAIALYTDKDNSHIPAIEVVDNELYVYPIGYVNIYKMPKYHNLQTGSEAAKIYNRLAAIYKEYGTCENYLNARSGYEYSYIIVDAINEDSTIPQNVKDAIVSIVDASANYGDNYILEIARRNIKQDDNGNIVLLDIMFNANAL